MSVVVSVVVNVIVIVIMSVTEMSVNVIVSVSVSGSVNGADASGGSLKDAPHAVRWAGCTGASPCALMRVWGVQDVSGAQRA